MRFKKVPKGLENASKAFLKRKYKRPVTIYVKGLRDYTSCYEEAYYEMSLGEARMLHATLAHEIEEAEVFLAQFEVVQVERLSEEEGNG